MTKRIMDLVGALSGLLLLSPLLSLLILLVWLQDFRSPFYIATRAARGGGTFRMVKLRSMVVNADRSGVTSTASADSRITPLGRFIRASKLDEFMQLWNVLLGDMSLVGPRPNLPSETDGYTLEEKLLLTVKPGITDFASIVFADEGEILEDALRNRGYRDADLAYQQLIRPWKSRLGIFYAQRPIFWLDLCLVVLTLIAIVNRSMALRQISRLLTLLGAVPELSRIALRDVRLQPCLPPRAD